MSRTPAQQQIYSEGYRLGKKEERERILAMIDAEMEHPRVGISTLILLRNKIVTEQKIERKPK